jgi:hypothetical protein
MTPIPREAWHPSLTDELLWAAARRQMMSLEDPGFCISCGHQQGGVEPDARRHICESCGARQVYGAEELVLSLIPPWMKRSPRCRSPN